MPEIIEHVSDADYSPPPGASVVRGAADNILAVIERAATDPSVDIEKMERLLEMHERIQSRQAETEFNSAMTLAQGEMGRISTDAMNPQTRSAYATYGKLDSKLRPIYTTHGFALSFDTGDAAADMVRVVCRVSHRAGFSRVYHIDMPADGKGAKGGDVMTKTHATGAAASYGMRYLLKMIFNVAIGQEDDDGNGAEPKPATVTTEQAAELKALLMETNSDTLAFLKAYGGAPSVDELSEKAYAPALKRLNEKLAQQRGAKNAKA